MSSDEYSRVAALEVAVDALSARVTKMQSRVTMYVMVGSFLGGLVAQWVQ